jgi:site-specific recombinase XerD
MAGPKRAKATASNKQPVPEERRAALFEAYLSWLEGRPLAARSREAYAHQVRRYLAWLGDRSPVDGDPLADRDARDWAVRDYKRHLKSVERWKPASVNLALAALDSFYTQLGLGRPIVRREELSKSSPRAISEEEQRRLLRIGERAKARDRAIVVMLLYTGLRLAELVALDVDDVKMSARKGVLVVRSGKGDAYRELPLNALAALGRFAASRVGACVAATRSPAGRLAPEPARAGLAGVRAAGQDELRAGMARRSGTPRPGWATAE